MICLPESLNPINRIFFLKHQNIQRFTLPGPPDGVEGFLGLAVCVGNEEGGAPLYKNWVTEFSASFPTLRRRALESRSSRRGGERQPLASEPPPKLKNKP